MAGAIKEKDLRFIVEVKSKWLIKSLAMVKGNVLENITILNGDQCMNIHWSTFSVSEKSSRLQWVYSSSFSLYYCCFQTVRHQILYLSFFQLWPLGNSKHSLKTIPPILQNITTCTFLFTNFTLGVFVIFYPNFNINLFLLSFWIDRLDWSRKVPHVILWEKAVNKCLFIIACIWNVIMYKNIMKVSE